MTRSKSFFIVKKKSSRIKDENGQQLYEEKEVAKKEYVKKLYEHQTINETIFQNEANAS